MADEIKKFSSITGKTYAEVYAGTQLHAFSGSQKAVVKDIKIKNTGGKAVQIKKDNATTGHLIGVSTGTGVFSGNEICDNSASIHLKTDVVPVATSIINFGSRNGSTNHYTGTTSRGYVKWSKYGVIWENPWVLKEPPNNMGVQDYEKATVGLNYSTSSTSYAMYDGQFIKSGPNGKTYGMNGHSSYGYYPYGTSSSHADKYKVIVWPSNATQYINQGTNLNDWGGMHLWDNGRYIYVVGKKDVRSGASEDNIWRYDTVNESSTTYRTKTPDGNSDVDIGDVSAQSCSAYYIEEDGVPYGWFVPNSYSNGSSVTGGASGDCYPCLINLSNGKKRHLINTQDNKHGSSYCGAWSGAVRRSIGCCKLSEGGYALALGNVASTSWSSNDNVWQFYNIGSLSTFIDTGLYVSRQYASHSDPSGSKNNWNTGTAGSSTQGWSYSAGQYAETVMKRCGCDGKYHHSQLVSQAHNANDFLYMFNHMVFGASGWSYTCQRTVYFDMTVAIQGGKTNEVCKMIGNNNTSPASGNDQAEFNGHGVKFLNEDSAVNAQFGTIDAECSGVLIT